MTAQHTVSEDALVFLTQDPTTTYNIKRDTFEQYLTEPDEFLIESRFGYIYIARLTGRTCQRFGIACPTVERYEVDTIADERGVIYGARGGKVPGTLAVRPEHLRRLAVQS